MNQLWINKQRNDTCILFFNGWGMDENTIMHIDYEGLDVCMLNRYHANARLSIDTSAYNEIYVIAWSMGVWVAEQTLGTMNLKITGSIAINGTSLPVDDSFGIPEKTFLTTLQSWNEWTREKFNIRMMGGKTNVEQFSPLLSKRRVEEQREELEALYLNYQNSSGSNFKWDKAIIGTDDLIFPRANQLKWWIEKCEIEEIRAPHFPFAKVERWRDIISSN